jgi:hypothetical protein
MQLRSGRATIHGEVTEEDREASFMLYVRHMLICLEGERDLEVKAVLSTKLYRLFIEEFENIKMWSNMGNFIVASFERAKSMLSTIATKREQATTRSFMEKLDRYEEVLMEYTVIAHRHLLECYRNGQE